jgi:hypothetical protein
MTGRLEPAEYVELAAAMYELPVARLTRRGSGGRSDGVTQARRLAAALMCREDPSGRVAHRELGWGNRHGAMAAAARVDRCEVEAAVAVAGEVVKERRRALEAEIRVALVELVAEGKIDYCVATDRYRRHQPALPPAAPEAWREGVARGVWDSSDGRHRILRARPDRFHLLARRGGRFELVSKHPSFSKARRACRGLVGAAS